MTVSASSRILDAGVIAEELPTNQQLMTTSPRLANRMARKIEEKFALNCRAILLMTLKAKCDRTVRADT